MRRGFVYLFAFALPMLLAAETFKVTLDREARVGGTVLKPGDYKVTVEGGKAEFDKKGGDKVMADVKEEKLDAKAAHGYVKYTSPDNRISEIMVRGATVHWLFP